MARSNEMADDTSKHLPNFADIRPTRGDDGPTADAPTVTRRLGSADPAFAPGVPTANRSGFAASGSVAAVAHALALLAFMAVPTGEYGSGGTSVDAISVSIISAAALETREPSADLAARAAPDQIAPREGDSEIVSQAAPDRPKETVQPPKRETVEPPPVEVEKEVAAEPTVPDAPALEKVPDVVTTVLATPKPPEPKPPEPKVAMVEPPPPERQPEKPKEEKPTEETSTPSPEAVAAGGAASRGIAPDLPPASAAAAASRGDVNAYGLEVQAALLAADQREAKARIAATRAKGTVVLRIVIAGDGALERADIQTSSGHRHLDEAAVQLVRLTAFPRPPASLTADQRAYIAPIVFR